ncbi:hypothetical protein [Kosakonia sp. CFBP8986]|uniref:hypothetical protein n=1 Tax=Kosakonia sp. CFBP8986 TaxID=3096524 RepID=UPI002A6B7179|nr:hypothetical protein [Kosakonia sp. CFBP8986]MDY0887556.1 hypothetical protein [Kosakonia sp. CFBP8986]
MIDNAQTLLPFKMTFVAVRGVNLSPGPGQPVRKKAIDNKRYLFIYSLSQITAQDYQQILSPLRRGNKQKTKIQIIFYIDALDEILNYGPKLIARKY